MREARVEVGRLLRSMAELNEIGLDKTGGVTRLALSDEDKKARDLLVKWMEEAGLRVVVDDLGNMYGWREGRNREALPVVFGSHLDTVPNGGRFDGVLGVAAGLEVMRVLEELGIRTKRPLVLVNWTNEEGVRFAPAMLGSGVVGGVFSRDYAYSRRDDNGKLFGEELERIGYKGSKTARLERCECYVELHIEQGPMLEDSGTEIGAVEGIQGICWLVIDVLGQAGHAGTTPIGRRRDALIGAAAVIEHVARFSDKERERAVATVGKMRIWPNAVNVIAEAVEVWVDVRSRDLGVLERARELSGRVVEEVRKRGLEAREEKVWVSEPVLFDEGVVEMIEGCARRRGLSVRRMWSGAGHDAKHMVGVGRTAMIFVPCRGGLSHVKEEEASERSVANGAQVLLDVVVGLASA